jgi:Metallo-peptidase family M12
MTLQKSIHKPISWLDWVFVIFMGIVWLASLASADTTPTCKGKLRTIPVIVGVDDAINAKPGGTDRIRNRVAFASKAYEESFNIKFEVRSVVTWNPQPNSDDFPTLREQLKRDLKEQFSGIVVGYMSNPKAYLKSKLDGLSSSFERTILLYNNPDETETTLASALAHEIGHCFGAWHSNDETSIMYGAANESMNFDPQITSVVCLTRTFDFDLDVTQLGAETEKKISAIYEGHHPMNDPHMYNPVAYAYGNIGGQSFQSNDYERAEEEYCWAEYLSPEDRLAQSNLPMALYHGEKFAAAWRAVHIARRFGVEETPGFLERLRGKMPEPLESLQSKDELCQLPKGRKRSN